MTVDPVTPGKRRASSPRSPFFDNAKLTLIALVAVGHFTEKFAYTHQVPTYSSLWFFIYIFHMPAFIFTSGMFAKGLIDKRPFQMEKLLRNIAVYVVLVVAIFLDTRYCLGQHSFTLSFVRQGGLPWYLLAIILYPVAMLALRRIRPAPLLIGSVAIALLAGLDNSINDTLALSRVLVYAPFYIAGYLLPIAGTEQFVRRSKLKFLTLAVTVGTAVLVFGNLDSVRQYMPMLSARRGYADAGFSDAEGMLVRASLLALAAVIGYTLLAFTPHRISLLWGAGTRTLQIYVLHYFLRDYLVYGGALQWLRHTLPSWWVPLWLCVPLVVVALVSSPWLSWTVSWSDRLRFGAALRRDQPA